MKARLSGFLKSFAVGMGIAAAVFALNVSRSYGFWRCVCDGFFVSAVMMLGVGAIKEVRNRGAFDVAEFGLRHVVTITIPALNWEKEDLLTFKDRKFRERRGASNILLAGAVMLVLTFLSFGVYSLTQEAA